MLPEGNVTTTCGKKRERERNELMQLCRERRQDTVTTEKRLSKRLHQHTFCYIFSEHCPYYREGIFHKAVRTYFSFLSSANARIQWYLY